MQQLNGFIEMKWNLISNANRNSIAHQQQTVWRVNTEQKLHNKDRINIKHLKSLRSVVKRVEGKLINIPAELIMLRVANICKCFATFLITDIRIESVTWHIFFDVIPLNNAMFEDGKFRGLFQFIVSMG